MSLEPESEFATQDTAASEVQYALTAVLTALANTITNLAALSGESESLATARAVVASVQSLLAAVRKPTSDPTSGPAVKSSNAALKTELDNITESLPGAGDALRAERAIAARALAN